MINILIGRQTDPLQEKKFWTKRSKITNIIQNMKLLLSFQITLSLPQKLGQ